MTANAGAILGSIGLFGAAAAQVLEPGGAPLVIVPLINLTAIIAAAIAMGMFINRIKQLERRVDKIQRVVFREEDSWNGHERRVRPPRG